MARRPAPPPPPPADTQAGRRRIVTRALADTRHEHPWTVLPQTEQDTLVRASAGIEGVHAWRRRILTGEVDTLPAAVHDALAVEGLL